MRLALILWCAVGMAQTVPSQFQGLSTSTDNLYPFIKPPKPLAGATYVDTYHPNGTGFVGIQRLPALPSNCTVRAWSQSGLTPIEWPVTYGGKFYFAPASAKGMVNTQTKTTTSASAAGTNVIYVASTAVPTVNYMGGFYPNFGYTVTGTNIPAGTTITSFDATSITLSANITGAGVASGATITFATLPTQAPWVEITQAEACDKQSTVVSYSARQAWNSDGTRFIVLPRTLLNTAAFYRTGPPVVFEKFLTGIQYSSLISTNGSETWSKDNPDEMFFFNNYLAPKFSKVNVVTGVITDLYNFQMGVDCPTGSGVVQNGGAGQSSTDQRYWAAFCKDGQGKQFGILVYDKVLNQVVSKKSFIEMCGAGTRSLDVITMSPSGKYVAAAWYGAEARESVWTPCHGMELLDRTTLASIGMVFSYGSGHSDMGYDVNGREVMVTTPNAHKRHPADNFPGNRVSATALDDVRPPPYDWTNSYVKGYQLPCTTMYAQNGPDPFYNCQWGTSGVLPGGNTWHVSMRGSASPTNATGWMLASTVTDGGMWESEGSGWGKSENLAIRIDTLLPNTVPERKATFRRISRNLSSRFNKNNPSCSAGGSYWQEAHGTPNADFTKVLFSGSWLVECGKQDAYIVDLPTQAQQVYRLTVTANRRGEGAVITFGRPLLPMSTSCTVTALNGSTTVATLTAPTGRATRQVGFSELPSVNLTFSVACGTEIGSVSTLATPALTGTADVPITRVGAFTVNYGPALASSVSGAGSVTLSAQPLGVLVPFQICGPHCGVTQFYIP